MTFEEMMADREAEERQRMLELVNFMIQDGLVEAIPRLREDEVYCKEMLEKYHLE